MKMTFHSRWYIAFDAKVNNRLNYVHIHFFSVLGETEMLEFYNNLEMRLSTIKIKRTK